VFGMTMFQDGYCSQNLNIGMQEVHVHKLLRSHASNEIKKNSEESCTYTCCNKSLHNICYYILTCLT